MTEYVSRSGDLFKIQQGKEKNIYEKALEYERITMTIIVMAMQSKGKLYGDKNKDVIKWE